jgi:DNA-binding GntR family transcriptional regulator
MDEGRLKWTSSDRVYGGLRSSIIRLRLKPGEAIDMAAVAEEYGVSRSPVRDALLKLEKEGLVDLMPQKGSFVSRIDLGRMHEERFLRASLEEKVVEAFIASRAEADMSRLQESLRLQRSRLEAKDYDDFLDIDDEFHHVLYEGAGKRMCWDLVQSMSGHYRRARLLVLGNGSVPRENYREHRELFDRIKGGDAEGAIASIRAHLAKLNLEEGGLVEAFPDYFARKAGTGGMA